MSLWWSLYTLYLLACQVRVTANSSCLHYCASVTSFKLKLTPLCVAVDGFTFLVISTVFFNHFLVSPCNNYCNVAADGFMSVVIGTVFFISLLVSPCNNDCNVAVDGFMFLVIGTMLYNQVMVVPCLPWCNPPSQVEMQAVISPPSAHNSPRSNAQSSPRAVAAGKKNTTIQDAEESYQSCTDEQSSLLASPSPGRRGGKYI